MPSPTSTIQRRDLGDLVSEYALERSRESFIGLELMPSLGVMLQSGNYPIIPVEEMLKPRDTKRNPRGGYNRGDWGFEQGNFATEEFGWEELVDDSLAKNYGSYFEAEAISARIATDVLLRGQEARIQTLADTAYANAVSVKWSTSATATPRKNIEAGIKSINQNTGMLPNVFACTWQTFNNLIKTNEVLEATKYTGGGAITMSGFERQKEMIAEYFGVDRVIVSNAVQNGNNEGSTSGFSATQIWNDAYGYLVVTSAGPIESGPSWGRSFLWTDDSPNNVNIESYRDEEVRGEVIRARHNTDEKILNSSCMYRLTNLA